MLIEVSKLLLEHNIRPNCNGYYYLRDCILMGFYAPLSAGISLKNDLYVRLQEKYGKSAASIEKAMASSIERCFLSMDIQACYGNLVLSRGYKLSNKAFVMQMIERLRVIAARRILSS